MRLRCSLLLSLLAAPLPTAAQAPAVHHGWHLGGGVDALRFEHVAMSDAEPGAAADVRPSGRVAFRLTLGRAAGPWNFSLEAGWADGEIEIGNEVLSVRDRTSEVTRYRFALGAAHQLTVLGANRLGLELTPTVDLWSVAGDTRARAGAEGRLLLLVPLGGVDLENRIGIGYSGSPIEASDLGDVAEERGLWTFLAGLGLRVGL